ncbi:unnamed protein product [Cladocopium goreaui]|uniref:Pentatricopeptide repeat-containing protein n=1 Tax=Cladocopium goreaui TaxID=2562237 RepID=A0A9P1FZ34_9DINO|nr:unnamed protein product [Cladocopium goreaui]
MEGAVQQVIGTGSTGHTTTANKQNIMMNRPEGIAVHSSTVFVSDTMNHRIIMVPILEYEPLGCYKEVTIEGESTLIPSLEGDLEAGLVPAQVCRDEVLDVADAVARCARATIRKGWEVFAVRCGGVRLLSEVCASAIDADNWYRFNGWSTLCEKGRGGLTANSVYRIIKEHAKDLIGNFYIIAGQALTTETGEAAEKPRAGFFGRVAQVVLARDRLASWLTAMDEPSQMAASEITRNLFFGDRGNKRVRVIFGSLGPQPQTQQFYCTNGLECVLNVNGNGFSEKDHIAFSRDYFTSAVVCGQDRLEDQFPQEVTNIALRQELQSGPYQFASCWTAMGCAAVRRNVVSYNALIGCGVEWQVALHFFHEMLLLSVTPTVVTFTSLITCGKAQWLALQCMEEMAGHAVTPNVISYNAAISSCEWQMAVHLFDCMETDRIEPNVITFSSLMTSCGNGGSWQIALQLTEALESRLLLPNVVTYTAAMAAFDKSSQWQRALAIFDAEKLGCNERSCSAAMSACSRGSQWQMALEIWRDYGDADVISYNTCMTALERGQQWEMALELFREMQVMRRTPRSSSYNAAMAACAQGSNWQLAIQLCSDMRKNLLKEDVITFNAMINSCEKSSQWDMALAVLHQIDDRFLDPNLISYSSTISSCEKSGHRWHLALQLFQDMLSDVITPDVVCYNSVISACEKGMQWQTALHFFDEMRAFHVPNVVTYSALISSCEKAFQWEVALDVFQEMKAAEVMPNVVTFGAIISSCEKGLQWAAALYLFHEMSRIQIAPNHISYNAAISSCEKGLQWQLALHLFHAMQLLHPNVVSFNALLSATEKSSAWQQTLRIFGDRRRHRKRSDVDVDVISFNAALGACCKGRQWQLALKLFHQISELAETPNAISYSSAIGSCELSPHGQARLGRWPVLTDGGGGKGGKKKRFIVCYCIGNAGTVSPAVGKECDVTQDFEFKAGRLHVVGPNARSTFYALAGVPFDLALFGSAFRTTDRIRLIRLNETCGAGGSTSVDDMLPFIRVAGNASLKAGIGPWDEGSETYQVWLDLSIDEAAELKVCWCNEAPCPFDSFFQVEAMYLSVRGPEQKSQVVEYGQPFDLLMEGQMGRKPEFEGPKGDHVLTCFHRCWFEIALKYIKYKYISHRIINHY